jgi:hypothetical protein
MKRAVSLLCPAFAAAVLVAASALPVSAAPEPTGPGGVSDAALLTVVGTVGDDAFATTDLTSLLDPTGASTQHYGPYASESPDSGTCGNDWADDTFDRHFTVHTNSDGTFTVIEQFKNGTFITPAPLSDQPQAKFSPGACPPGSLPQGTVKDGVTGDLHGYFIIPLTAEKQRSMSPYCDAMLMNNTDCTTTKFVDTHFTPCYGSGLCSATTFFDHYIAVDQGLIYHEWKNASPDRGGNSGDIRSANL